MRKNPSALINLQRALSQLRSGARVNLVHLVYLVCFVYLVRLVQPDNPNRLNKAPRSSLLRRSSHFGYEGRKLRGIRRKRINKKNQLAHAPRSALGKTTLIALQQGSLDNA